jgi:hypothetical protein
MVHQSFSTADSARYSAIIQKYLSASGPSKASFLDKRIADAIEESVRRHLEDARPKILAMKRSNELGKASDNDIEEESIGNEPTVSKTNDDLEKPVKKSFAQAAAGASSPSVHEEEPPSPADDLSWETVKRKKKSVRAREGDIKASPSVVAEQESPELRRAEDDDVNVLIIPTAHGGPRVFDELRRLNIDLDRLGARRTVEFTSGAVLCECKSMRDKEKVVKVIDDLERLSVKRQTKSYQNSVRVQNIPIDVEEEELVENILEHFNEVPTEVLFIPYKDNRKYRSKAVLLYVSDSLYKKASQSPYMRIRGRIYNIDASLFIKRCSNCQLLGHRTKFCESRARPIPSPDEDCVDCVYYNEQLRKSTSNKTRKYRDVNHPTDDENCPSKAYFMSKWKTLLRIEEPNK